MRKLKKPSKETCMKIERVIRYMRKEPRRVSMEYWGGMLAEGIKAKEITYQTSIGSRILNIIHDLNPPCGAVGCFAGNCLIVGKLVKPKFKEGQLFYTFENNTGKSAARWLGITPTQAASLFFLDLHGTAHQWPISFQHALSKTNPGTKRYIEVIVSRLRHFKKTGE